MDGLRATREALKMGEGVLVFPEGERTHDGKMQQLRAGVSLLLKLEGLTILPVGIAGAFASWPRTRTVPALAPLLLAPWAGTMAVVIGNPIQMSEFEGMSRDEILAGLGRAMALTVADAEELRRK
jgi:1-acyl-sn-glycerol-3-phosphate acyltransferase